MVIGGTNINRERSGLSRAPCDVLVATPGRLQDHLDTTEGFAGRLWGVQVGLGGGHTCSRHDRAGRLFPSGGVVLLSMFVVRAHAHTVCVCAIDLVCVYVCLCV
jgi:hypothetical protein